MVATRDDVVDRLRDAVPEFGSTIDEPLAFYEEELAHVLFGDLVRFVLAARSNDDAGLVERVLAFADLALRDGDPWVRNLIQVSLVENVGPWDDEMSPFSKTWPDALRAEAYEQRRS